MTISAKSGFSALALTAILLPTHSVTAQPMIGKCPVFPVNNIWNTPIDSLPADTTHSEWIDAVGRSTKFHMDFAGATDSQGRLLYGIPKNLIPSGIVPKCASFSFLYADESDLGGGTCSTKYALPSSNLLIENGSDHHLLTIEEGPKTSNAGVDSYACTLFEIFDASYNNRNNSGSGGSGAVFNLNSNDLRPETWTSADAAGLPIFPGLIRYEEASSSQGIQHAIRFTVPKTNGKYIWPARHKTGSWTATTPPTPEPPPMGARLRLKNSYTPPTAVAADPVTNNIIVAMKKYGIINADNGSAWFISGESNVNWDDARLRTMSDALTGDDFEVVDTSCMIIDANSGQANPAGCGNGSVPPPTPTPTPAPANCSYTLSSSDMTFKKTGGSSSVGVAASSPSCTWSAKSNDAWVNLPGSSFTGSQLLKFSVAKNLTRTYRSTVITIGGTSLLISQKP